MINKPLRLSLALLLCVSLLFEKGHAQNSTRSPYSYSGIGDISYPGFAQHVGMGRTGRANQSEYEFTNLNPASYAHLKLTSMQIGGRGDMGRFTAGNKESTFSNATLGYFSLGFPILEKTGTSLVFGVLPHSNVGYNLVGEEKFDSFDVRNNYTGNGGLTKVYAGTGIRIGNYLSAGVNVNYLFGNINENQARVYLNNKDLFSYATETSNHLGGFNADFGVQFSSQTTKGIKHTLGATYHIGNELDANLNRLVRTFNAQGGFYIDTIEYLSDANSSFKLPNGMGFAYQISKPENWGLNLEWSSYQWSDFRQGGVNPGYKNSSTLSGGFFYQASKTMEKGAVKGEKFKKYVKNIRYTAGGYLHQSYVFVNSTQIKEFGTTLGLQLPVMRQIKLPGGEQLTLVSRVNISAEYAQRGTTENNLLKEDYVRIYLGFSFSDKWFIKRKFQ
jgi:hypothetical protein